MQRCLQLAELGAGLVAPNPLVGAVLVQDDRIIGEGWHRQYGQAHAEVNAINQATSNGHLDLSLSTLYVSLEPCSHFGKTPPCTDLIIQHNIPKVVIGCRDPFREVNGKGIEKLKGAGVQVEMSELDNACRALNKRFFTFHTQERPYVILKWAQTANQFISTPPQTPLQSSGASGDSDFHRLLISNEYTNRLVHSWRSEEAAILIGTNTALMDDPELTTRLWPGRSPVRLVLDMELRLPATLKIFNKQVRTIIFNSVKQEEEGNLLYYQLQKEGSIVQQVLNALFELNIQSVLVEGGAKLLQSFIDVGIWDEARIITNDELILKDGLSAPLLNGVEKIVEQKILSDRIEIFKSKTNAPKVIGS